MAATIVELDTLANTIGPAAENDDLARFGGSTFAGGSAADRILVRAVHIRRERQKFRGAAVDTLEHRPNAGRDPCATHLRFARSAQPGELRVRKSRRFDGAPMSRIARETVAQQPCLHRKNGFDLFEKPRVVARDR